MRGAVSTTGLIGSCGGEAGVQGRPGVQGNHHCPEEKLEKEARVNEEASVVCTLWQVAVGRAQI